MHLGRVKTTLTLQSLLFSISLLFSFPIFLAFFLRFPSFSKDFRGSAKRKTLAFWGKKPLLFPKKHGLEGQGSQIILLTPSYHRLVITIEDCDVGVTMDFACRRVGAATGESTQTLSPGSEVERWSLTQPTTDEPNAFLLGGRPCVFQIISVLPSMRDLNLDGPAIPNANRGDSRESIRVNSPNFHNVQAIRANRLKPAIRNLQLP